MQEQNNIRQYPRKPRPAGTLAGQKRLLTEFANLRDEDAEKFRAKHPTFLLSPQLQLSGWQLGAELRGITAQALVRANEIANSQLNPALLKREILRRVWRAEEYANDFVRLLLYASSPSADRVEFNWKRGEITYEPRDDFERAVYALFRNSALAKVCENAECDAPYFIAKRVTERYCHPDCAALFQREWKRRWWKKEGSERRRKQRTEKAKKGRKGR